MLPLNPVGSSLNRRRAAYRAPGTSWLRGWEQGSKPGQSHSTASLICETAQPVESSPLKRGELLGAELVGDPASAEGAEQWGNLSSMWLACCLFTLKIKAASPEKKVLQIRTDRRKKKWWKMQCGFWREPLHSKPHTHLTFCLACRHQPSWG